MARRKLYRPILQEGVSDLVTVDGNLLEDNGYYSAEDICENDFPTNEILFYYEDELINSIVVDGK